MRVHPLCRVPPTALEKPDPKKGDPCLDLITSAFIPVMGRHRVVTLAGLLRSTPIPPVLPGQVGARQRIEAARANLRASKSTFIY